MSIAPCQEQILEANQLLAQAEILYTAQDIQTRLQALAHEISVQLHDRYPLVLAVMGGAVVFAGQLLPLLSFPLDFDYLHLSRYGKRTIGGELIWRVRPTEALQNRTVLVLDDILDEGETMAAIRQYLIEAGAKEVYSAVLINKMLTHDKPIYADFVGMHAPERYLFGFGMDVQGMWRNLPAIYALKL